MNESPTAASLSGTHYRLSKKVAQLTKVVVHLNTANESVEIDKQKLSEAHHRELEALREETEGKIDLLQNEIRAKDEALKELNGRLIATESSAQQKIVEEQQEAQRRCMAVQNEAAAKEDALQARHEEELKATTDRLTVDLSSQAAKELEIKLNDLSEKHKAETASLQENLKREHRLSLKRQREKLTNRHNDEIYRIKSQHEKTLSQFKVDATEHERVEVENAVTLIKAEYEQKKYQQIVEHNQKCQAIKAEVTHRLNAEIARVQNELTEVQAVAREVPILRSEIYERDDREKKLKSEVRRLQDSLEASTASNQCIIDRLKGENEGLQSKMDEMKRALDDCGQLVSSLNTRNNDLNHRIGVANEANASLEADVGQLEDKCCQMCTDIDNRDNTIASIKNELSEVRREQMQLNRNFAAAQKEVAHLTPYKRHVEVSRGQLKSLQRELAQANADVREMRDVFACNQQLINDWRSKLQAMHFDEILQLEKQSTFLREEVERLESIKADLDQSNRQLKEEKLNLEQRIQTMECAAADIDSARSGERLSWEKAMEELKAQHKKEIFHMRIVSADEQDILKNQIASLKTELANDQERNERKCQILEADCSHKLESLNAAISKVKYESALETQQHSKEKDALVHQLKTKEEESVSLLRTKAELEHQVVRLKEEHQSVIDKLRQKQRQDAEDTLRVHVELFRQHEEKYSKEKNQLVEQKQHLEQEKESIISNSQARASEIRACSFSAYRLLQETKQMHSDLKSCLMQQHYDTKFIWDQCQNEISAKLKNIRQNCISIVEQEKSSCSDTISKLNDSCDQKIAAAEKEADDAKKLLFQSIREYEAKHEREIRHLKEEHSLHVSRVANESKSSCDDLSAKFKNLYKEFEAVIAAGDKKELELSEKGKDVSRLEMKIIDLTKQHDDEMQSLRSHHQSERDGLMRDLLAKESTMNEEFAEVKSNLQAELDDVRRQLKEANEQFVQNVSNEVQNMEQIKSLQKEVEALQSTEKVTREKMMYFKRELENRETNYNTRFSTAGMRTAIHDDKNNDNAGVLRVIQNPTMQDESKPMPNRPKKNPQQSSARRKVSDTKRKSTKKTSSSLPKLAK